MIAYPNMRPVKLKALGEQYYEWEKPYCPAGDWEKPVGDFVLRVCMALAYVATFIFVWCFISALTGAPGWIFLALRAIL